MPSVVLNSYESSTGCLDFTIFGTPTPTAVTVQQSIDNGITWNIGATGAITSPRCGFTVTVPTLFRVILQPNGEMSNVISSTNSILPTAISTPQQVTFCNSPININLEYAGVLSAYVYLYIWNGSLNQTLTTPNVTLFKNRVSADDDYVHFEISDYIRSFLVAPPNATNTSQPNFVYNELTNPTITGQGCFWQIVADVTTASGITRYNFNTNFATLGYKWNYEQNLFNPINISTGGSLGFAGSYNKYYNPRIHNYIAQNFDLTKSLGTATSANVISVTDVTPPAGYLRCSQENYLIVYLNKVGLFEMFTPHGKVSVTSKIESETSNRNFRNPTYVDNNFMHSEARTINSVIQSYAINTGLLRPDMVAQVEELIYSPKVYLIEFKGDLNITTTEGVTIDNSYITIDDLNTSIDGLSVTDEYLAYFKTHRQIPVTITNSDFERKVRLNNRNAIDFTINFKETNSKINNIR